MDTPSNKTSSAFIRRLKADFKRDKRKMKALFVLLPLLGVAMIPIISGGYPSKSVTKPIRPAGPVVDEVPRAHVDQELRAQLALLMQRFESAPTQTWSALEGTSAFASLSRKGSAPNELLRVGGPDVASRADAERARAGGLLLSATYLSPTQGNVATIDGKPYREGDQIESFLITAIGVRYVVLRGNHGEYPIEIPSRETERK